MADLFHLDAELLDDPEPQEPPQDPQGTQQDANQNQQQHQQQEAEEWTDLDAEQVDVPLTATTTTANTTTTQHASLTFPDRVDLQDIAATVTTQDLDYTKLCSAWMQEMQSPELLPFPSAVLQTIKNRISKVMNEEDPHSDIFVQTGNEGLDVLLTSLITIDTHRLAFVLADLLKRRMQKIEAHPFYMEAKLDCMSSDEQTFWQDYRDLVQHHLHQTVIQHFPNRENWPHIIAGQPDSDHHYCFAYCLQDVPLENNPGDIRPQAAGNRIIVRYNKIKQHVQQGSIMLI